MGRVGPALVLLWYQTSNQVLAAVNKIGIKQQTREIDPEQVLIPDDQEGKMAFTCRPEEQHEQILQRICKKYHINTKQRALFHVLERFEEVEADHDELMRKVRGLESELSALQQAVRRKIEADENLLRCIDDR